MIDFDEEFAGVIEYARMYRQLGLQVVPSIYPGKNALNWKRPALPNWREYQKQFVSEEQFEKFLAGQNQSRMNIGILTGACSGRVFVVDLDTHKVPDASIWWDGCLDMQDKAGELETPTQKTGGGGIQMLFRAPEGWEPPTIKTTVGVDIRGVGGFAVIAPSMHESGKRYRWEEGCAPWEIDIAEAPAWFCEQIDALGQLYGGHAPAGASGAVRTDSPAHQVNPWGRVVDGREDLMARIVFREVIRLYRECPIMPPAAEIAAEMELAIKIYFDSVEARLVGSESKEALLEREGRGRTLFAQKWRAAFRQWDGKISQEAARPFAKEKPVEIDPFAAPPPKPRAAPEPEQQEEPQPEAREEPQKEQAEETSSGQEKTSESPEGEFETKRELIKLYTIEEIENFGPPQALIENLIVEESLGFIYGKPGSGKTFVGISLGMSIAYGLERWFHGRKVERHGSIVYISLEGKSDLGARLRAFRQYHKLDHYDPRFRVVFDQVNFLKKESVKLFVDSVDNYVSGHDRPAMIIIDTVSRAIAGGRENDVDEISRFIETCDQIKRRYGTNVCGIGHSGHAGDHMRGSSAFEGAADYMLRLERKDGMEGLIHAEKIKAYPDKWQLPFRLVKHDLDAFGAQSSLVATTDDEGAPAASAGAPKGDFGGKQQTGTEPDMDMCRKMVSAIQQAWDNKYPWTRGNESDRNAAEKLADMFGLSVDVCKKYVNMWHRQDVIVTDRWGDKSEKKGLRIGKGL